MVVIFYTKVYLVQDKTVNTRHAAHEMYWDKKSDSDHISCDGTLDCQSVSPADYQPKVIHTMQTTDRGMLTISQYSILFM